MDILILNNSAVPLYEQISSQIKAEILRGALVAGDPLPSIRNLARDLRVSIITTKRAYDDLEAEGFLTTIGGKGSFVSNSSTSRLRDAALSQMEDRLDSVIDTAKSIGISAAELCSIVTALYEKED